ncbi:MAG TPA: hypothetical protein EYH54_01775 [Nautiliaceae bacterium]|nr:hypothetical protein [Nautiliaceae bacterium]
MKIKYLLPLFFFIFFVNELFALEKLLSQRQLFYFIFVIFAFSLIYTVLSNIDPFKDKKKLSLIISISAAFLLLIILQGPFAKYFFEVFLPFFLFTIFVLILIYVFFQSVGIKFGNNENESGFINTVSTIVMWVGVVLFLIIFIAALKEMGYSIVDRMLEPGVIGVFVFLLVLAFIIMTVET